jgi:hypothetical protein
MKVSVHFYNGQDAFDQEVKIELDMPYIPRLGDIIVLTGEQLREVEDDVDWDKYHEAVYGNEGNKYLTFDDYQWVTLVAYNVRTGIVMVELSVDNIDSLRKKD